MADLVEQSGCDIGHVATFIIGIERVMSGKSVANGLSRSTCDSQANVVCLSSAARLGKIGTYSKPLQEDFGSLMDTT